MWKILRLRFYLKMASVPPNVMYRIGFFFFRISSDKYDFSTFNCSFDTAISIDFNENPIMFSTFRSYGTGDKFNPRRDFDPFRHRPVSYNRRVGYVETVYLLINFFFFQNGSKCHSFTRSPPPTRKNRIKIS